MRSKIFPQISITLTLSMIGILAFAPSALAQLVVPNPEPSPVQLYAVGGTVTITFTAQNAGASSQLWLFVNGMPPLDVNPPHQPLSSDFAFDYGAVYIGNSWTDLYSTKAASMTPGQEAVFAIRNQGTGTTLFMGPGVRNRDGFVHAHVQHLSGNTYEVRFEDLAQQDNYGYTSDFDYNDVEFTFDGLIIPEPSALAIWAAVCFGSIALARGVRHRDGRPEYHGR